MYLTHLAWFRQKNTSSLAAGYLDAYFPENDMTAGVAKH